MKEFERSLQFARLVSAFLCVLACVIGFPAGANAQAGAVQIEPDAIVDLWPGTPPGAPNPLPKEEIVFRSNQFNLIDRAAHQVAKPNLSLFRPNKPNGAAILIIPGGGYSWVGSTKKAMKGPSALPPQATPFTCCVTACPTKAGRQDRIRPYKMPSGLCA